MRGVFAALLAALSLLGCKNDPLTREDYAALNDQALGRMTRIYHGISAEEIIRAGVQTLENANLHYRVTQASPTGFEAVRVFAADKMVVAEYGEDFWTMEIGAGENGALAATSKSRHGERLIASSPFPTVIKRAQASNGYIASPTLYNLFYARMDYFLGLRSDWTSCEQAKGMLTRLETPRSLSSLCG